MRIAVSKNSIFSRAVVLLFCEFLMPLEWALRQLAQQNFIFGRLGLNTSSQFGHSRRPSNPIIKSCSMISFISSLSNFVLSDVSKTHQYKSLFMTYLPLLRLCLWMVISTGLRWLINVSKHGQRNSLRYKVFSKQQKAPKGVSLRLVEGVLPSLLVWVA